MLVRKEDEIDRMSKVGEVKMRKRLERGEGRMREDMGKRE